MHGEEIEEFFSGSLDKTIRLWKDRKLIDTWRGHADWIRCLSVSENNSKLISGCVSSNIKCWDIQTRKPIFSLKNTPREDFLNTINALTFAHQSENIFVSGTRDGIIRFYDTRTPMAEEGGSPVAEFKAHLNKLNTLSLMKNNRMLLSSGRDSSIRMWDLRRLPNEIEESIKISGFRTEYTGFKCSGFNITCGFLGPNQEYIVTGSEDTKIHIFHTEGGAKIHTIPTSHTVIHLVKGVESKPYSFVMGGMQDPNVYLYVPTFTNINIREGEKVINTDEGRKEESELDRKEREEKEKGDILKGLYAQMVEEVMAEFGDLVLKIMHKHRCSYSHGMNWEGLIYAVMQEKDTQAIQLINQVRFLYIYIY